MNLVRIGKKINKAIEAVYNSGLSIEELLEFEDYISHQETTAPLLNPGLISKHGFGMFDAARSRVKLLKEILQLRDSEKRVKDLLQEDDDVDWITKHGAKEKR